MDGTIVANRMFTTSKTNALILQNNGPMKPLIDCYPTIFFFFFRLHSKPGGFAPEECELVSPFVVSLSSLGCETASGSTTPEDSLG
jgi:hypothetical protein